MNQSLWAYRLDNYYSNHKIRLLINFIYIICQIVLSLYLLFIPIQIAYYWLLATTANQFLQTFLDIVAVVFFFVHIVLYLDQKLFQWVKSPYTNLWGKIVTLQFVYDWGCEILAIYAVVVPDTSIIERIIQLIFFFKIYKLIRFDIKCMYIVIGTWFYSIYKILRTLLIMFMAIAYVGSLFYGIAYYLYSIGIQYSFLLWIVDTGAISECVQQPFIIQLQYAMYWALGTASTAAYGDISGAQPALVLINILALAFEGFLFGFYLNSMHSIPMQRKQRQANLLQKFDAFQQHCSNRKIDKKLYLQILCSLQYSQSQKKRLNSIQSLMPRQYVQQIKSSLYSPLLQDPIFFPSRNLQLNISQKIHQNVSEMGEDVYNYKVIGRTDLIFIQEGTVHYYLEGEIQNLTNGYFNRDTYVGMFSFVSGLAIPHRAVCVNYCFLYRLTRQDYKLLLPQDMKLHFNDQQNKAFKCQGSFLKNQPIMKLLDHLQWNNSQFVFFNPAKKQKIMLAKYNNKICFRKKYERSGISRKTYRTGQRKTKDVYIQTQNEDKYEIQIVYNWTTLQENGKNNEQSVVRSDV